MLPAFPRHSHPLGPGVVVLCCVFNWLLVTQEELVWRGVGDDRQVTPNLASVLSAGGRESTCASSQPPTTA